MILCWADSGKEQKSELGDERCPAFAICVTLGKVFNFSALQFPHL